MKIIKFALFSLTISLFLFSCIRTPYGIYYKIKKGDTLYRISTQHEIKVDKIKEVNNISDETSLQEGEYIFLPGISLPAEDGGNRVHSNDERVSKPGKNLENKPSQKRVQNRVSFMWPIDGVVTSLFGARSGTMHEGIDIGVPIGRTVLAAADGKIIFSGRHGGYGLVVIIMHKYDYVSIYAHNSSLKVEEGQKVKKGQLIAKSGNTGKSTGPHLHFEIRKKSKPVNPLKYLPKKAP